jgi:hypothetical protein
LKLGQYGQALFDEGVEEVEDLPAYTGWAALNVKPFHKEKILNAVRGGGASPAAGAPAPAPVAPVVAPVASQPAVR